MMEQTFQYPNLLTGTRSGEGWFRSGSGASGGYNPDTGITLYNSESTEDVLYSPRVTLHKNTDYTLHCLAANTANMASTDLWVFDTGGPSGSYQWIGARLLNKNPGPVGAWLDWTFRLDANARDGVPFQLRFDNNGSTDGKSCLIWFRDIMLTEGTEPRAWAPASGEVWPE
jgi:hypothetical protein